jgi:molybdenum cofactor synthesis domain-containing protein
MSTARVITASNRASAGVYEDRTGPVIVAWLGERGYTVPEPVVVPDGDPVADALRQAVADGVDVVVTTGGTGVSPTDRTPEATRSVLDYEVPGLADAVRAAGLPEVPTAVLSRGVAGVAGRTLVVNLPGSTGGVRDGLGVLADVLEHAVEQLKGVDHPRTGHAEQRGHTAHDEPRHTGPAQICRTAVTEDELSVEDHAALVADAGAGAVVTFAGVVRDHDHGRDVVTLDYSGHPSAADVVERVTAAVAGRHPGLRAVAVSHRIGPLKVGDVALAVAVAAEHRRAAFVACAELVDEVKAQLPIWKHQTFADGTDEWVNCP